MQFIIPLTIKDYEFQFMRKSTFPTASLYPLQKDVLESTRAGGGRV
jgi:hypothetical protein